MFFLILSGLIGALFVLKIYFVRNSRRCKSNVCLSGKTVIVTGANTGIGFCSALEFAKRGAKVILACRNKEKAEAARLKIIKQTENGNIVVRLVDMSSLQSIRDFASEILKNEERLDILVNNAGAGGISDKMTQDGLQIVMQINYFGPFLLTILLLGLILKSPKSRIINVSSLMAKEGKVDPQNFNKYAGRYGTYANSKLCNILFTMKLAEQLKDSNAVVFSLHPGVVRTDIFRRIAGWRRVIFDLVANIYFKTPEEGAQTTIYTATEQNIEQYSGRHFEECEVSPTYPSAIHPKLADEIWDETCKLLQIEYNELVYRNK